MLTNATITRIDRAGGTSADGRTLLTQGQAVSIRCAVDAISFRHRYVLGAVLADADQVVYVPTTDLANAGETAPAPGDHLTLTLDGSGESVEARIITLGNRVAASAGALSHLELFVRRAPL